MPNTKSAVRRTKRTQLQASVNRIRKGKYKSAIKEMSAYLVAGDIKKAKIFLDAVFLLITPVLAIFINCEWYFGRKLLAFFISPATR